MQVRDFQAVIGKEVRHQCLEKMGGDPDILLACVGGGSNAIGLFHEFVDDAHVRLIGMARLHAFRLPRPPPPKPLLCGCQAQSSFALYAVLHVKHPHMLKLAVPSMLCYMSGVTSSPPATTLCPPITPPLPPWASTPRCMPVLLQTFAPNA